MRIGPFLSVVLVGIVGLFAWLVLRDGSGVSGDPGRRVAAAADADERRPPPAITPASAAPSREPERIEEEVGGGVEATGYAVGEGGDEDDAALHGDADLDVTTVVPEEDHWLWSQLPPKILVFRSRRDAMAPDFETLVTEERRRCAAMGETELRGVTEEGRPPTEAELRADVANNFDQIRREKLWGVAVARAVATLDEPAHVRGLAPGRCFVTLQRGDSPRHPRVFDEQVVELASGTNAVTLTLPLEEERPRVRIAGTIRYSSDWGGRGLRLDFDPASVAGATEADERSLMLSDQKPVEGSPDLYPFEIGDLRPGRYLVTSSTLDWRRSIVTGAEGRDDVAIVIPDPAEVVLHLVDDASGSPISEPILASPRPGRFVESRGLLIDSARWDERAKSYRLHVPAGEFAVDDGLELGEEFESTGYTATIVRPGSNDVTVRVRHSTVVAVSLQCNGESIEVLLFITRIALESLDDPDHSYRPNSATPARVIVRVPAAGRYRVTIPAIAGYADVAPLIVTAREGERTDCKVELFRKR